MKEFKKMSFDEVFDFLTAVKRENEELNTENIAMETLLLANKKEFQETKKINKKYKEAAVIISNILKDEEILEKEKNGNTKNTGTDEYRTG